MAPIKLEHPHAEFYPISLKGTALQKSLEKVDVKETGLRAVHECHQRVLGHVVLPPEPKDSGTCCKEAAWTDAGNGDESGTIP